MENLWQAIVLTVIWSGALFGDDGKTKTAPGGYRDGVVASPLDNHDPDPLVDFEEQGIPCYKVYAFGGTPGLTPYYKGGLGAPKRTLGRLPVANAIKKMNEIGALIDREYVVVDALREDWVQARLFANVYDRNVKDSGIQGGTLPFAIFFNLCLKTDDIASYNRMDKEDPSWHQAMTELKESNLWVKVLEYAANNNMSPDEVASEYLTFIGNLSVANGEKRFKLDRNGFTAHGGGGACDIYPRRKSTGKWCNLGVPFDSTSPASQIDWFETHTREEYEELVNSDLSLRQYLDELGVTEITDELMEEIRLERRYLYNCLMAVGGTPYWKEPWHCNFPHKLGGKHSDKLPEECGNSCQSWIREVRDGDGNIVAIWTNSVAHKLAEEFFDAA